MSEYVTSHGHPFSEDTREKVGVIVYDSTGKILIVKGVGGKLSLPKGGRMRGETELEGAVREAWEETGLDLESLYYTFKTKLIWGTYYVFKLSVGAKELCLRPRVHGEIEEIMWKSPKSFWLTTSPDMNCDLKYLIKNTVLQDVCSRS
jgi:8-oxo-dGTP pyrophosphatase MutT (NUDIX family)